MNNWETIFWVVVVCVGVVLLPITIFVFARLIGYGFTIGKKRAEFDSKSFNPGDSRNGS